MKIMALDVGEKSCGIALSDKMKIIAQGKKTFYFASKNWDMLIAHLESYYLKEVELIVVGLPLLPSGDKSKTTLMIEDFTSELQKRTIIPIKFIEEYKTTKIAHDIMINAQLSRQQRKKHVNKMAATLILQRYLENINH